MVAQRTDRTPRECTPEEEENGSCTQENVPNGDDRATKASTITFSDKFTADMSAKTTSNAVIATTHFTAVGPELSAMPTVTASRGPQDANITAEANRGRGSDGVSKGAVAGIAIATAIIGAAIAFLIAFLLFKKRNNRERAAPALGKYGQVGRSPYSQDMSTSTIVPHHQHHQSNANIVAPALVPAVHSNANIHSDGALAGIIPTPAQSSTVSSKISNLFAQIHLHVDNFYRDIHAGITPSMEAELSKYGMGDVSMVEQLQNSSNPTVVIKHGLVAYILGITSPEREEDESLFPKAVVGIASEDKIGEAFRKPLPRDLESAYGLYKRLSVFLYHNSLAPASSSSMSSANSRNSHVPHMQSHSLQCTIREAAEHFSLTFFPWANPTYGDQEKDEDLVQIISTALDLIIWLYGQPFVYEFVWEDIGRRGTVIAPKLVVVGSGQVLLEPIVANT